MRRPAPMRNHPPGTRLASCLTPRPWLSACLLASGNALAVPLTVKPWARSALLSTLSLATLFTINPGASVSSVQVAVLLAASETLPAAVLAAASFCRTRTMPGAYWPGAFWPGTPCPAAGVLRRRRTEGS